MRAWTNEELEYLKGIYKEKFNDELAVMMNEHFNGKYRTYTASSISATKDRLGIHSKPKYGRLYRKEIIEFIQNNYEGKDNLELAELLNAKFNLNTDADKISMLKCNLKRRFGINVQTGINKGCFKKGSTPANKGTKGLYNVGGNKTSFKKGNKPQNAVPIGTEHIRYSGSKINDPGYLYVKIADGKGNKNWKLKHHLIYEQHYGKIPDKCKVVFADGNRFNFDIDNLILVSYNEELIMNRNKLFTKDKEITNTGAIIAKVIAKGNKLKKERVKT